MTDAAMRVVALARHGVDAPAPDRDEARELLERELERAEYREAEPAWFDIAGRAIVDFFERLLNPESSGSFGAGALIVVAVVVVALIVIALLIWGRPRATIRGAHSGAALFGETEQRSARELRRAADAAVRAQRFDEAIVLRIRAMARGLAERGIVLLPPGATVHAFARRTAVIFPAHAATLDAAADAFDEVRYLRGTGSPVAYTLVRELDAALVDAHPTALAALESPLTAGARR
ncbi:MAG: DUF4129 domain-containing protein [Microbacteriaceae bacterium]